MSTTSAEFQRRLRAMLGQDGVPDVISGLPVRTSVVNPPNTDIVEFPGRRPAHRPGPQPDAVCIVIPDANKRGRSPDPSRELNLMAGQRTIGTLAEPGETFCPIIAISKYPYKFVKNPEISASLASRFFAGGKFWQNRWQIYYVWPPQHTSETALLLVPSRQVENFISMTDHALNGKVPRLSDASRAVNLVLRFGTHPAQRPRYLGLSSSQDEFKQFGYRIPNSSYRPPGEPLPTSSFSNEEVVQFAKQIAIGIALGRSKRPKKIAQHTDDCLFKTRNWVGLLSRTETFLGLRPQMPDDDCNEDGWDEICARDKAVKEHSNPPPVPEDQSPPYPRPPLVFVSIDVEVYERDASKITEVGVATFDNRDIDGAPGQRAERWRKLIRYRHLRIKEHAHLHNTEFVRGCASEFKFGESEFVGLDDAPAAVAACFRPPFSDFGKPVVGDGADSRGRADDAKVVLVGHDVINDVRYLSQLGYAVKNLSTLNPTTPVIDTQDLHRAWSGEREPAGLAKVLDAVDIDAWSLHNAGNDAAYTLQAMLVMAVQSAATRKHDIDGDDLHTF